MLSLNTESSSNIKLWEYDPGRETLEITFNSGKKYRYYDVPVTAHEGAEAVVEAGASIGKYFHSHIKGSYEFKLVEG